MKKKLALIGVGKWGRNYLKTLSNHLHAELSVIVSSKTSAELSSIAQHQALVVNSVEELFAHKYLFSGVIVATPPNQREIILHKLLDLQVPLLIEKPLTLNTKATLDFLARAKHQGTLVIENFIHLYSEAFITLHETMDSLEHTEIRSVGEGKGPVRDYSPVMDYGPHDFAMILTLFREMPQKVQLTNLNRISTYEYQVTFELAFSKGNSAHITIGNIADQKARLLSITNGTKHYCYNDCSEKKLTINDQQISLPNITSPLMRAISELCKEQSIYTKEFLLWLSECVARLLDDCEHLTLSYPRENR